jgi:hypothetical protein
MSGVLRLGNTGAGTGRSTLEASASNDQTFTLPSNGGTLLTSNTSIPGGTITLDGADVNITNGDLNVDNGTLFVDESTNRVGIGTTTPLYKLTIRDTVVGGSTLLQINNEVVNNYGGLRVTLGENDRECRFRTLYGSSFFTFHTEANTGGPVERVRIDSAGRLLVGTSTASNQNNAGGASAREAKAYIFNANAATTERFSLAITSGSTNANGAGLNLNKTRATTDTHTVVQSGDVIGEIRFQGSDGTYYVQGARIQAVVDGTPGSQDMPGRLVFSTTADGASSPTERMRIISDGNMTFGKGDLNWANDGPQIEDGGNKLICTDTDSHAFGVRRNGTDGEAVIFWKDGTGVGSISVTTTGTTYNESSDYRLKENVVDITDSITRVKQLQPRRFNFIVDPDTTVDGFLAHEAQTVVPEAVTGMHNEVDDDGNAVMQGIDKSKLVPLLTAALQETIAKVEALEVEIFKLRSN